MKKSTLHKLQLGVFIIISVVAFLLRGNPITYFILFGGYYGFMLISEIINHLVLKHKRSEKDEESVDFGDETDDGKKEEKRSLTERLLDLGGLIISIPLWYYLMTAICPLDHESAQALDCLGTEISLISTIVAVMIINGLIQSLIEIIVERFKSDDDETAYEKPLIQYILVHAGSIIVIIGILLAVIYGTCHWGKTISEENLTFNRLWNKTVYSWESMEYYVYDRENATVTIQFDDETIELNLKDFSDTSTDVLHEKYGRMSDFHDYLFCEKYAYIPHEIL